MKPLQSLLQSLHDVTSCWNIDTPLAVNVSRFESALESLKMSIEDFEIVSRDFEHQTFQQGTFVRRQKTVFLVARIKEILDDAIGKVSLLKIYSYQGAYGKIADIVYDFIVKFRTHEKTLRIFVEKETPSYILTFLTRITHKFFRFLVPDWTGWEL